LGRSNIGYLVLVVPPGRRKRIPEEDDGGEKANAAGQRSVDV